MWTEHVCGAFFSDFLFKRLTIWDRDGPWLGSTASKKNINIVSYLVECDGMTLHRWGEAKWVVFIVFSVLSKDCQFGTHSTALSGILSLFCDHVCKLTQVQVDIKHFAWEFFTRRTIGSFFVENGWSFKLRCIFTVKIPFYELTKSFAKKSM